jgi:hypothetical protein
MESQSKGLKRLDELEGKTDFKSAIDKRFCAILFEANHDSSFEEEDDKKQMPWAEPNLRLAQRKRI